MNWREYHELSKHSVEALRRNPHYLDWANMPDPFRHYEGVPLLDLPAEPPELKTPALHVLRGEAGPATTAHGPLFLSQLLFHSAAISASKRVPSTGYKYALRVNPSSGNLHPTEFHFTTRGLVDWPDGLYHYRPSSHMAEQRAVGEFSTVPLAFLLTTIAWREAWKYRERAYRYCCHDIGHAWQALALAAQAMGRSTTACGAFDDAEIARQWRLHSDEWPMLLITFDAGPVPVRDPEEATQRWFGGEANELSGEFVEYPAIARIHAATSVARTLTESTLKARDGSGDVRLPAPAVSARTFGDVARHRRSALDFRGGTAAITMAQLSAILAAATPPLQADFGGDRFVQLYLYAHRVDGLSPGVYRHWKEDAPLELVREGDQRVYAAGLSLGQELAGNACVAFSMIADLERAARIYGDRGYRYALFEAGAIGHRLYLAAEALGLGATGIGAFYDDEVHRHLGIAPDRGQVVYHFAIGYPVEDPRLEA